MSDESAFRRSIGVWEGTYTLMDRQGNILDDHASRIEIRQEGNRRFQRNVYTWSDGRTASYEFQSEFRDGKYYIESPRLKGVVHGVGDDVVVLTWVYTDRPNDKMSEIIRYLDDRHRCRTWQFVEDGEFTKVMLIEERKVADSIEGD
jgi:hypothetical protein